VGHPAPRSGFIDDGSRDSQLEDEADTFASTTLIPPEVAGSITAIRSPQDVEALSATIGIAPGMVAGRYQYETGDYTRFNQLRRTVTHELFHAS
jgi:Zn-dependent peptidase ImmA (M78 family)